MRLAHTGEGGMRTESVSLFESDPLPREVPVAPGLASPGAGTAVVDLCGEEAVLDLTGLEGALVLDGRGLLQAPRWKLAVKRAVDVVGSLVLLVVLSPLLVLAGALVALTSRGPVLFVQERVGRDGRPFRMLKFRTMRPAADRERRELLSVSEMDGPVFKIRRDPRVTRVGRILRKLSIDELPQLVNVLRGEMSLVGPRPPLPEEWQRFGPLERQRLSVTPGITCIWQVSGRNDLDYATWVRMDLEYITTWSLGLDVRLLLRTLPAALSGRGAY